MKKIIEKIWVLLDGKKTYGGTVLLMVSCFFKQGTVLQKALETAGLLLGGTGVAHKLKKRSKEPGKGDKLK